MRDAETTRPRNPQAPSSTKSRGLRQDPFWPRPTSLAARWSPIGGFGSERWGRAPEGGLRSEACSEKGASEAVSFVPKVKYLTLACYGFSYGGRSPIIRELHMHGFLPSSERQTKQRRWQSEWNFGLIALLLLSALAVAAAVLSPKSPHRRVQCAHT
jgi:hypothetical protein